MPVSASHGRQCRRRTPESNPHASLLRRLPFGDSKDAEAKLAQNDGVPSDFPLVHGAVRAAAGRRLSTSATRRMPRVRSSSEAAKLRRT